MVVVVCINCVWVLFTVNVDILLIVCSFVIFIVSVVLSTLGGWFRCVDVGEWVCC